MALRAGWAKRMFCLKTQFYHLADGCTSFNELTNRREIYMRMQGRFEELRLSAMGILNTHGLDIATCMLMT